MQGFLRSLVLLLAATAAATRGTPDEAKALLRKAVEHYNSAGRAAALKDFNSGKAPYRDRDLYVVCIASDGKIAANGAFPQYVGTSADILRDAAGKPLAKTITASVTKGGEGVVKYDWMNPVTHKTEAKTLFTQKAGTDVCGVGAYAP